MRMLKILISKNDMKIEQAIMQQKGEVLLLIIGFMCFLEHRIIRDYLNRHVNLGKNVIIFLKINLLKSYDERRVL